jgi:ribonuclease HI
MLKMYTDGACSNNGKAKSRGSYAVVYPAHLNESFACPLESTSSQTNQTAELRAIYEGLLRLQRITMASEMVLRVCSDSEYSINCLTKWVPGWRRKDWKTAEGKPVVHREIIEKILAELGKFAGHQFVHVSAHTGLEDEDSKWNDVADRMARKALDEGKQIMYDELETKVIRSGTTMTHALTGIPLAIMGPPIAEKLLVESIRANLDSLDPKYLNSALLSAFKKTLNAKAYDLEKTKIHKDVAYRLVEKSHIIVERTEEEPI